MTDKRVLIIDADQVLVDLLHVHFDMAGYRCAHTSDVGEVIELITRLRTNLIISEVVVPGTADWEIVGRVRDLTDVPLLIISSRGDEVDKLRAFRLGADDYITKPFSFAELLARAGAVLARIAHARGPEQQVVSNGIVINFEHRSVVARGKVIELSPTEYRLLEALARRAPRPVSNDDLIKEVWGGSYLRESDHIKHFVWRLRRKIEEEPEAPQHILTVRGFGYQFA